MVFNSFFVIRWDVVSLIHFPDHGKMVEETETGKVIRSKRTFSHSSFAFKIFTLNFIKLMVM